MAGTSDEEMEKLLTLADQISDDFINGFHRIETLKSNYNAEISNRQSIELTCSTLKQENQRLKNLHLETLNNLLSEIQNRGDSSSSKEELTRLNEELLRKEEDHRNAVESMKRINEEKVRDLEVEIGEILKQKREELKRLNDGLLKKDEDNRNAMEMMKKMYEKKVRDLGAKIEEISGQKREDEATIYQLHHELITTRKKLKEVEVKWKEEVEDLKDCVYVEQQEKGEMSKKVRDLEKELLVTRTKMSDNHVWTSDKQLEMMKQKMMKLRKENEVLRRQVKVCQEG
ncbi:protein At-4/1-like [Silene latifolia]|uniref:protein At-4/1-like n=1 Tax=Silene latifolia TaxID=37657 RepID=UPI003D776A7A